MERTPPCRAPQRTGNGIPIDEFHMTERDKPRNQLHKIHMRGKRTFVLINLANTA